MNDRQIRFVQEYCKDFNATQAAIRAGYSAKTACEQASRLLADVNIQTFVDERKAEIAAFAKVDAAWVLKQWLEIASADVNELMQIRRLCCRHCYGVMHSYQWTEAEYMAAVTAAIERDKPAPDGLGGFGYDVNREPFSDCPECGGQGVEHVHFSDTRRLTGAARKIYAGVQRTKDGLKLLVRDQDAALTNIAKYLGMMVERKEISGPNGAPVALAHIKADDLTDDQLALILNAAEDD